MYLHRERAVVRTTKVDRSREHVFGVFFLLFRLRHKFQKVFGRNRTLRNSGRRTSKTKKKKRKETKSRKFCRLFNRANVIRFRGRVAYSQYFTSDRGGGGCESIRAFSFAEGNTRLLLWDIVYANEMSPFSFVTNNRINGKTRYRVLYQLTFDSEGISRLEG